MGDNEGLIRELKAIVGDLYVVHAPEDLIVFEYDGSADRAPSAGGGPPGHNEKRSPRW